MTERRGKGLKNTCKEVVSDAVWNLSCLGKQARWAKGTEQKPGTWGLENMINSAILQLDRLSKRKRVYGQRIRCLDL